MKFKGVAVHNPHNPRTNVYMKGGVVYPGRNMTAKQLSHDSVMAVLQPGELVIPKRFYQRSKRKWLNLAQRVGNDLRKDGIKLPGL